MGKISMSNILVLNGPNLNMLGKRQPEIYGSVTLTEVEDACREHGRKLGADVTCAQSNHEGALIDAIHAARDTQHGIILNAGAYTHTSIALMDAVASAELPMIEVHLSNIHAREEFRHVSYISKVAIGQVCGFGKQGYLLALDAMVTHIAGARA